MSPRQMCVSTSVEHRNSVSNLLTCHRKIRDPPNHRTAAVSCADREKWSPTARSIRVILSRIFIYISFAVLAIHLIKSDGNSEKNENLLRKYLRTCHREIRNPPNRTAAMVAPTAKKKWFPTRVVFAWFCFAFIYISYAPSSLFVW